MSFPNMCIIMHIKSMVINYILEINYTKQLKSILCPISLHQLYMHAISYQLLVCFKFYLYVCLILIPSGDLE